MRLGQAYRQEKIKHLSLKSLLQLKIYHLKYNPVIKMKPLFSKFFCIRVVYKMNGSNSARVDILIVPSVKALLRGGGGGRGGESGGGSIAIITQESVENRNQVVEQN